MSNIDKLKSAAAKAVDNFDPNMFVETRDVLALLDELEAKDRQIAELKLAIRLANDRYENRTPTQWAYDQACLAIEKHRTRADGAEKRIAELEAREVKLPKPISVLHRRDFMDAHRSIYAYPEAEVNAALSDAGIRIHGEY